MPSSRPSVRLMHSVPSVTPPQGELGLPGRPDLAHDDHAAPGEPEYETSWFR